MTEFVTNTKEEEEVLLKVCSNCTLQCACTTVASCIARLTWLGNWMLLTWTYICVFNMLMICVCIILAVYQACPVFLFLYWEIEHSSHIPWDTLIVVIYFSFIQNNTQFSVNAKQEDTYELVKILGESNCWDHIELKGMMTFKFHAWNFSCFLNSSRQ